MIFRKAILIIHGFAGGTFDLEYLANRLELQKNFDVYSFTLPGHEYGIGKVSYKDWIRSAEEHIEMLVSNGYKSIYVVGHSMGGVIASYIASRYTQVKRLVLAAPAFHYLAVKNDKLNILDSLKSGTEVIKEYKMNAILARYVSVPRNAVHEFTLLVKNCYDSPSKVNVPTLIIEGTLDNVVPMSSAFYVFSNLNGCFKYLLTVKGIGHDIFTSKRKEEVTNQVVKFLKLRFLSKEKEIKKEI